jgi:hypothetical protein
MTGYRPERDDLHAISRPRRLPDADKYSAGVLGLDTNNNGESMIAATISDIQSGA